MSVTVHELNTNLHSNFLNEGRFDPISKEPLRAGDRIVFCAICECAFYEGSWQLIQNRHCNQSLTMAAFPQRSGSIRFATPSARQHSTQPRQQPTQPRQRPTPTSSLLTPPTPPLSIVFAYMTKAFGLATVLFLFFSCVGMFNKNGGNSSPSISSTSSNISPNPSPAKKARKAAKPVEAPQNYNTQSTETAQPAKEDSPKALFDKARDIYNKDPSKAAQLFMKAAEKGYVKAQRNLGAIYHDGNGVSQDDSESAKWYKKAAENGDAESQYFLSFMLYKGIGVNQDQDEARRWLEKAARQGHSEAKKKLAKLDGRG